MRNNLRFLRKNKQSFIALFVLLAMSFNACNSPVSNNHPPVSPPEGKPEDNKSGDINPMGFFVDEKGNFTDTDSGRTILVADDKAEVVFYSDNIESDDDNRVGLTFEDKTIFFIFEKGRDFPGSIVLTSPEGSYNGIFTPYNPDNQTYGLTLEQGDVKETLSNIVLGNDIFTQYIYDEDLTPSQNLRMRNLYIAMCIYTSLDDSFNSDNILQSSRGIWGIFNKVAQVFFPSPITSIVLGTLAMGFGAANLTYGIMYENPVSIISGMLALNEGAQLLANGIKSLPSGSSSFIAVTGITGIPTTAPVGNLTLSGNVTPANATNKAIVWTVKSSGSTGAIISGNTLTTTASGTVTVTGTVAKGKNSNTPYTQNFAITITRSFVAVTGITGVPTTASVGSITLSGTVIPANATSKTIVWTVKSSGTTGAKINGDTFTTTAAGTVTVSASIANGKAAGTPYTQDFTITVTSNVKTYTVTFNKNNTDTGSTEAEPLTKIVTEPASKIDSLPAQPARQGYTFNGWNTQANGSGTAFTAATTVAVNITVYAQWAVKPITSAPTGLSTSGSTTSIYISWSGVPGATGYYVYRNSSDTGTYTRVGTPSSTSFTDTDISKNTIYYYKVSAYNSQGEGPQSEYVQGMTKPNPPTNVSAVGISAGINSGVRVTWDSVPGARKYVVFAGVLGKDVTYNSVTGSYDGMYRYGGESTSTTLIAEFDPEVQWVIYVIAINSLGGESYESAKVVSTAYIYR